MRPLTFINGVIFACSSALAGGLMIILLFRWTMRIDPSLDQALVQSSLPLSELCRDLVLFTVLATLAGITFRGEIRRRSWFWGAEAALAFAVATVLVIFFADAAEQLRDLGFLAGVGLLAVTVWVTLRVNGMLHSDQHRDGSRD